MSIMVWVSSVYDVDDNDDDDDIYTIIPCSYERRYIQTY